MAPSSKRAYAIPRYKNKTMPLAAKWIDLEMITSTEVS